MSSLKDLIREDIKDFTDGFDSIKDLKRDEIVLLEEIMETIHEFINKGLGD